MNRPRAKSSGLPRVRTAADLMQKKVVTIEAGATLRELAELLEENAIHGVPVIDAAGTPIGVVSRTDLVAADVDGESPQRPTHHWYAITDDDMIFTEDESEFSPETIEADRTVREIMSPDLITAKTTATAAELARKMARHSVHRLLITEGGRLAGIVSVTDVLCCVTDYEVVVKRSQPAVARQTKARIIRRVR